MHSCENNYGLECGEQLYGLNKYQLCTVSYKTHKDKYCQWPHFIPLPICHICAMSPDKYTIYGEDESDKEVKSSLGDYDT